MKNEKLIELGFEKINYKYGDTQEIFYGTEFKEKNKVQHIEDYLKLTGLIHREQEVNTLDDEDAEFDQYFMIERREDGQYAQLIRIIDPECMDMVVSFVKMNEQEFADFVNEVCTYE